MNILFNDAGDILWTEETETHYKVLILYYFLSSLISYFILRNVWSIIGEIYERNENNTPTTFSPASRHWRGTSVSAVSFYPHVAGRSVRSLSLKLWLVTHLSATQLLCLGTRPLFLPTLSIFYTDSGAVASGVVSWLCCTVCCYFQLLCIAGADVNIVWLTGTSILVFKFQFGYEPRYTRKLS